MYMGVVPEWMSVNHMHDWCLRRPEEGIGFPVTVGIDGFGLSCGCWE